MKPFLSTLGTLVLGLVAAAFVPQPAGAQQGATELEEVVVLGARTRGTAYEDLAVPVDVYDAEDIAEIGSTDLGVVLQRIAPSFNSKRNSLGDGGLFHTAQIRGMSPDHTLLLVNGKRRHGISFPRPLEQAGQGTTGYDMRSIPVEAIERIEVLRDGAAAQYGSDAIAGVINIVLRENGDESTASAYYGMAEEGNEGRYTVAANVGIPAANGGAVNITLEYAEQDRMDRAFDTSHLDVGGPHDPPIGRKIIFGEPEFDATSMFLNGSLPMMEGIELYAFGGWSKRNGVSSGAWRDPVWAPARMVGTLHPDGFAPLEESEVEDRSLTVGFLTDTGGWDYDVSFGFGSNAFDFGAANSINASWAADWLARNPGATVEQINENAGPTSGDSGGTELSNFTLNADVSGQFGSVSTAFGAEWREERFRIRSGDYASWGCGLPPHDGTFKYGYVQDDGAASTLYATCGHQGYPGYSPANAEAGRKNRSSYALWTDFRNALTSQWDLQAALRFEDHQRAGNQLTGMLGTRVDVAPAMSLRFAASTGFRAPGLAQAGFNATTFGGGNSICLHPQLGEVDKVGDQCPPGSSLTPVLSVSAVLEEGAAYEHFGRGSENLEHETSRNFSAGMAYAPNDDFSMSFDAYRIFVDDRITLTGFECKDVDQVACDRLAVERGAAEFTSIRYFDNLVDTRTSGLDFVMRRNFPMATGNLTLSGALHYNRTEIIQTSGVVSDHLRSYIEKGLPQQKHTFAVDWAGNGPVDFHLGANYFGSAEPDWFEMARQGCGSQWAEISSAWIMEAEVGWRIGNFRLAVGADNLLDKYPHEIDEACQGILNGVLGWGLRYNPDTSYGLAGRIWYTRLSATF